MNAMIRELPKLKEAGTNPLRVLKNALRRFKIARELATGDKIRHKRHMPVNDVDAEVQHGGGHFDTTHPEGIFPSDKKK